MDELLTRVLNGVRKHTRDDSVTAEMPLMDAGLDSLSATMLAGELERQWGIALPPTLVFQYSTPHAGDTVYMAMCYPYTYSMLQASLGQIVSRCRKAEVVRRERLCYTAGGLCATTTRRGGVDTSRCVQAGGIACDLISVSDFSSPPEEVAAASC